MAGMTYRDVLLALLMMGGLAAFALGRDKLRSGFLFFICSLGLGYRTLPLTEELRIHPAEVLLWALLAYSLIDRGPEKDTGTERRLPRWMWLFMPFWLIGWVPSAENVYSVGIRFAEFRNFLLLIPLFFMVPAVLARRECWRWVILTIYAVSAGMAFLGVLEYVFPEIPNLLPGFVSDPSATISAEGFARARFSFWGGPHATFFCVLAMPLALSVWRWYTSHGTRAFTIISLGLQLAAVYIGGYRSMWLLATIELLLFLLIEKRYVMGVAVLLAGLGAYRAMPEETHARLDSLGMLLQGRPIDSSGIKRQDRALEALAAALEHPAGSGWASAGWVHSDFIQVAANLGVLAGLIFLAGYVTTLWRLWLRVRSSHLDDDVAALGLPLFLSFVVAGGILAIEGVEVLPQTVLPIWLIWVLAETWLRQTALVQENFYASSANLCSLADLQLRHHRA